MHRCAPLLILALAAPALAQPIPPQSPTPPTDPGVHPMVYAFHRAFRAALDPSEGGHPGELTRFDAIVRTGTEHGQRTRLAIIVADRAVRVFTPIALDAVGARTEAAQLRALAPITDLATARAASERCAALRAHIDTWNPQLAFPQPYGTISAMLLNASVAAESVASAASNSPTSERSGAEGAFACGDIARNAIGMITRFHPNESDRAGVVTAATALLESLVSTARAR